MFGPSAWLWLVAPLSVVQWECRTNGGFCSRSQGWWNLDPALDAGYYGFTVEGCDVSWTGAHTCNQGWTNPVYA